MKKKINKEIMRMNIRLLDEYDMDLYNSKIISDEYILYTKPKDDLSFPEVIEAEIYTVFESIRIKSTNQIFEFNLN